MERLPDRGPWRGMNRARFRWLVAFHAVLIVLWFVLGPVRGVPPVEDARPAVTYNEAIRRIDRLRAAEDSTIRDVCRTRVIAHGRRVERAVVLLHGLTNCPKQFEQLGLALHRRGFNVLVPRVPRHGIADRMTTELSLLTAKEIVRSAEEAIDIAHGLGMKVSVAGLSSGAVVVAYVAQHRDDLDRAMLIAPSFAPKGMPAPAARRFTNVLLASPNVFVWWDSRRKAKVPGPEQAYPRFATRALAEVYRLGFVTLDLAARDRPKARSILIVTTAADGGVNNGVTRELARRWRARGADVREYEFPASDGVRHDMIDPDQPYERIEVVYPRIMDLLEGSASPAP